MATYNGHLNDSPTITFRFRFIYGKDFEFQSASTALSTLYAAHKYLCSGLIEICVKYLDENLNTNNVLEIYSHARLYTTKAAGDSEYQPSAPLLDDTISTASTDLMTDAYCNDAEIRNRNNNNNNNHSHLPFKNLSGISIPFWSEALFYNCLQYIDEHADLVLKQENIEDLDAEGLKDIIRRDTLKIRSEFVVFSALDRWANRECKRRKLGLSPDNRRLVLGELIFELRFPYMSSEEFISGPVQSNLLDQSELAAISALVSKSKDTPYMPQEWLSHVDKICRKRSYSGNESVTLSQRTYLIEIDKSRGKELKRHDSIFRKSKNKKKCTKDKNSSKAFRSMSVDSGRSDKKCSSCFAEYMLNFLSCIFD